MASDLRVLWREVKKKAEDECKKLGKPMPRFTKDFGKSADEDAKSRAVADADIAAFMKSMNDARTAGGKYKASLKLGLANAQQVLQTAQHYLGVVKDQPPTVKKIFEDFLKAVEADYKGRIENGAKAKAVIKSMLAELDK